MAASNPKNLSLLGQILEKHKTQVAFSKALGVDQGVVSRVLRGRWVLNEDEKKRWAKALGLADWEFEELMS